MSRGVKFQGQTDVSDAIPHGAMTKLGDWSDERRRAIGLAVDRIEQKSSVSCCGCQVIRTTTTTTTTTSYTNTIHFPNQTCSHYGRIDLRFD